jgi:hypothetical protein
MVLAVSLLEALSDTPEVRGGREEGTCCWKYSNAAWYSCPVSEGRPFMAVMASTNHQPPTLAHKGVRLYLLIITANSHVHYAEATFPCTVDEYD